MPRTSITKDIIPSLAFVGASIVIGNTTIELFLLLVCQRQG